MLPAGRCASESRLLLEVYSDRVKVPCAFFEGFIPDDLFLRLMPISHVWSHIAPVSLIPVPGPPSPADTDYQDVMNWNAGMASQTGKIRFAEQIRLTLLCLQSGKCFFGWAITIQCQNTMNMKTMQKQHPQITLKMQECSGSHCKYKNPVAHSANVSISQFKVFVGHWKMV